MEGHSLEGPKSQTLQVMEPPFPSREELKSRGYSRETLDLYDSWREAHGEALKLAARLPGVFGDPPRPRITLSVARGYDDEWTLSNERVAELRAFDPEQHWMEVSAEAVQSAQEYFNYADAEGWRFYLPAFLQHYLAGFPLYQWGAVHTACVRRDHFDLISAEQVAFVDEFLTLCQKWESG